MASRILSWVKKFGGKIISQLELLFSKKNAEDGLLIPWVRLNLRFYGILFAVFSSASFLYGYLYYMSYRSELGISNLSIPFDSIESQFMGGMLLVIEHGTWIFFSIVLISWLLFFSTHIKRWVMRNEEIFYFSGFIFSLIVPLLLVLGILSAADRAEEDVQEMREKLVTNDLIVVQRSEGKVDSIDCNLIHVNGSYVVYMVNNLNTPIATTLPSGSFVYQDIYEVKEEIND